MRVKQGIYLTSPAEGRDPTFEIFEQTSARAPAPAEFFRLSAQFHERGSGLSHFTFDIRKRKPLST